MRRYRWLVLAVVAAVISFAALPAAAQEEPKEPTPPAGEAPPPPEEALKPAEPPVKKSGPGFWGDHFALYIEAGGGTGSAKQLNSSIQTAAIETTLNLLDMDLLVADVAVGWKLPNERGSFVVEFTGFGEDTSVFSGSGKRQSVANSAVVPDFSLNWWNVHISDGTLTSTLTPPTWSDTNGDLEIQQDEVVYAPSPVLSQQAKAPDEFQNRLQTYDFLFYRNFGGRVWSARYSCGLRYLLYQGNVPATAWLTTSGTAPETGFTDGVVIPILYLREDASGIGPTGSLELDYNLFKKRLTLFGQARFAFLFQNLEVDSGEFVTFVATQDAVFTAPARIQNSTSQGAWNIGGRVGARVRVVEGFHVELYYDLTAYHDVVLLPFEIQVPNRIQQIPRGTSGLFNTQNLEIDSVRLVLGFQF